MGNKVASPFPTIEAAMSTLPTVDAKILREKFKRLRLVDFVHF